MKRDLMGQTVRDPRSGLTGKVVGVVTWLEGVTSLVVQPPVREDRTAPPTTYVPEPLAEVIPQVNDSKGVH